MCSGQAVRSIPALGTSKQTKEIILVRLTKLLQIKVVLLLGFNVVTCSGCLWRGENNSGKQKLAEAASRGDHVYRQYHDADHAAAKAALLEHVRFLDQLGAESSEQGKGPYAVDAMISYVRLAKLEEKNNGIGKAEYMREAAARCERLKQKWGDCSVERLRRQADQMDSLPSR